MKDKDVLENIKQITAFEYQKAFIVLRKEMTELDLQILKAHYESPNYVSSAKELAKQVRTKNFNAINLRYGLLADKFLEFFHFNLTESVKINIFVSLKKDKDEWVWTLRPQVALALKQLNWF